MTGNPAPHWWELEIRAPDWLRESLPVLLAEFGTQGAVLRADAVVVYLAQTRRDPVQTWLETYRSDAAPDLEWDWRLIRDEPWWESWKEHFRPTRVAPRLAVSPTWVDWQPDDPGLRVVRLDPGRAFGTGTHETTRLCLRLLDREIGSAPPPALLDVGCGSGVLAVAAALLGVPRSYAFDMDPVAARVTRDNAVSNGVGDRVAAFCGDLRCVRGRFGLVVANILLQILLGLAPRLAACVAPGGRLILSGLLVPERDAATAAYVGRGLRLLDEAVEGEWAALVFTAP